MQIRLTPTEIREMGELLNRLTLWQKMMTASGEYNQGKVTFSAGSPPNTVNFAIGIDRYPLRSSLPNAVAQCDREIGLAVADAMDRLAAKVCDIIRAKMPVQVVE